MAEDNFTLAHRYASALADVMIELGGKKAATALQTPLTEFVSLSRGKAGLFFANPIFDREEKFAVLDQLAKEKKIDPHLHRFLQQVIRLGHVSCLEDIAKAYGDEMRERKNQIQGTVRTAYPLSSEEEKRLKAGLRRVTGKEVLLNVSVDKDLIGGVVAEVGGVIYDASIRSYVSRMQQES